MQVPFRVVAVVLCFALVATGCRAMLGLHGSTSEVYAKHEKEAIKRGWQKTTIEIKGQTRQVLWKSPGATWPSGVIVALHGGSGTYSNYASNIPLGKPMVDFGNLALQNGFAVICPDSVYPKNSKNQSIGKRWDCLPEAGRQNHDLSFLHHIITKLIPEWRPEGSSTNVYMTGISNGGFMTILYATHYPEQIVKFAPVACGDPYGTYLDMDDHPFFERKSAGGVFHDLETGKRISEDGAGFSTTYSREYPWPEHPATRKPPFKQFHHEDDRAVDVSVMQKATIQLVRHGYPDAGAVILRQRGGKSIFKHFWVHEYNQRLIDFFRKNEQ